MTAPSKQEKDMRRLMIAAVAVPTFASATTASAGNGSGSGRTSDPHTLKPATGSRSLGTPTPLHPAVGIKCDTARRANGNAARPQLAGDPCH